MNANPIDLALAGATLNSACSVSPREASVRVRRLVALDLKVDISGQDGNPVTAVVPRQGFRVQVLVSQARNPTRHGWTHWSAPVERLLLSLHDDAGLLQFDEADAYGVPIEHPVVPVEIAAPDLAALDQDNCIPLYFNVTAAPDFADTAQTSVTLKIQQSLAGGLVKSFPQPAIRLLGREGDPRPSSPTASLAVDTDLSSNPLPDAAWLRVRRADDSHLQVHGASRFANMRQTRIPIPDIDLAQIIQDKGPPIEVLGRLRTYSQTALSLVGDWLKRLLDGRAEEPGDLCLVVDDQTDQEIPWELVETRENRFLGTQAVMVRWLKIRSWEDQWLSLAQGETLVEGDSVHFLGIGTTASSAERDAFCGCCGKHVDSLTALLRMLKEGVSGIALVYLSSHGIFHDARQPRDRRVRLWSESRGDAVYDIDLVRMHIAEGEDRLKLPLVFVNACHSGRMTWHEDQVAGHGMPELFLSRVARAYVGTLGDVSVEDAERIGARIIAAARNEPEGLAVAALLTSIRRDAAAGFDDRTADNAAWQRLLSSFMYVYYGDPRIRLRLRSA